MFKEVLGQTAEAQTLIATLIFPLLDTHFLPLIAVCKLMRCIFVKYAFISFGGIV